MMYFYLCLQSAKCEELHLHAENLSRRVWELLMLLPTCPNMLQAFQNISDDQVSKKSSLKYLQLLMHEVGSATYNLDLASQFGVWGFKYLLLFMS